MNERHPIVRQRLLGLEVDLLAGFLVLALLALLFGIIASEVLEGDTLAWDRAILRSLRETGRPDVPIGPVWLGRLMRDVTTLGGGSVLTLVTAIVAGYLFTTKRARMAMFLLACTIGGSLVGTLLKQLFVRARPAIVPHLVEVNSMSFPSGHALNSAVIYLTVGALLARAAGDRLVRIYIVSVALFLTIAIGISRIYLGVHYPSDVLAGWCAGAAWAAGCASLARALQRRQRLRG